MYIWLFVWFLLIIIGMKRMIIRGNNLTESLSYENTIALRGIMAIEIMIGHFYGSLNDSQPTWVSHKIGVLVVGSFLFLSGWGLWESKEKKKSYFKGFLRKHLFAIILPVYLFYLVQMFINAITQRQPAAIWLQEVLGRSIVAFTNWFIWEILVLYLLFYILYKYVEVKKANRILTLLMVLLIMLGSFYQIGTRWYGSVLCFLLGILFSQNKQKVFSFLYSKHISILIGSVLGLTASILLFIKADGTNILFETIFICLSALLFSVVMVLILMKIKIGNPVSKFLGMISYEIFISHTIFITFFETVVVIQNDVLYVMEAVLVTIASSYLIHLAIKWLHVQILKDMV